MPYFGNYGNLGSTNNQQRNAITQALLQVANPNPRTQIPGGGMGATRAPNVVGPQPPLQAGAGPTTSAALPGQPGVPGQFNPYAAPGGPPAATGMDPNAVQGVQGAPAVSPVGAVPPMVQPSMPGGPPLGPTPNMQQILGNAPAPQVPGSQMDPTRQY